MSFPPGTEMFQFSGLAYNPLFDSGVLSLHLITEVQDLQIPVRDLFGPVSKT